MDAESIAIDSPCDDLVQALPHESLYLIDRVPASIAADQIAIYDSVACTVGKQWCITNKVMKRGGGPLTRTRFHGAEADG
jgi:hypothetical protein